MSTKKKIKKFNLEDFVGKSRIEKKNYIIAESKKIIVPKSINKKLVSSYRFKEVINKFIVKYISQLKKSKHNHDKNSEILKKITSFKENYINNKLPKKLAEKPKNLFVMSGAKDFYSAQLVLRSITTTLGNFWEEIATISDVAISPDEEFGIKIKGIDLICIINNKPTYIQMKTMEGTLTGSQNSRSEDELKIHKYKYFAAVFNTGSDWTFNSEIIKKLRGEEFWSKINLDYSYLLEEVKLMIIEIEKKFNELKNAKN